MNSSIEQVCEVVRWEGEHTAYIVCPGRDQHTGKNAVTDCWVKTDKKVPYAACLHQSCRSAVAALNADLRDAFPGDTSQKHRMTPEDREEKKFRTGLGVLRDSVKNRLLPSLIKEPVPLDHWRKTSPVDVGGVPVEDQWRPFILGMFKTNRYSRLWIGNLWETSKPDYELNFQTVERWCRHVAAPGPQISGCIFCHVDVETGRPVCSRRAVNVVGVPYLIAESDRLSREEFGAVVVWLQSHFTLRAVVDTGSGRSLHCWFDPLFSADPAQQWILERRKRELKAILCGLGCDTALLRLNCTARLPGHPRLDDEGNPTGKMQELLYFNPKYL